MHCFSCDSWFDVDYEPVLFQQDGGDDVPDDQPLSVDEREELRELLDDGRGFSGNPDLPDVQGF